MIQRLPFSYPGTIEDVARLSTLLRDTFKTITYKRPEGIRLLNLACGRADETGALAAAFAPSKIVYYAGIDIRENTLIEAKKRWFLPGGTLEFIRGDASEAHKMKELPKFEFIFIRHQNYWHDTVVWDQILANALNLLTEDGVLVFTSYFDKEHELCVAALNTLGAEMVWNARNIAARALQDARGKSVDRHLAIFCKPGQTRQVCSGRPSDYIMPEAIEQPPELPPEIVPTRTLNILSLTRRIVTSMLPKKEEKSEDSDNQPES